MFQKSTYQEFRVWIPETTKKVIERIESNILSADRTDSQKMIKVLEYLCDELRNKNGKSLLEKIVGGYLCEFSHQSEEGIEVCNIRHGRNPEALKYWSEKSSEEFEEAIFRGVHHTAISFLHIYRIRVGDIQELLDMANIRKIRSPIFQAVGQIIRATIDVFKSEFPKLNKECKPLPSLYNDHHYILRYAFNIEDLESKELVIPLKLN